MRERRAHARVSVPLDARVEVGGEELSLEVRELSRSGIFLLSEKVFAQPGQEVLIRLAIIEGIRPLSLHAEVLRIAPEGPVKGVALKFVRLGREQETALLDLIDRGMMGPGTSSRAYPRVAQFLRVRCGSKMEAGALLRDIGEGGAGLEVHTPMKVGDEIAVAVSYEGMGLLPLNGFIVSCRKLDGLEVETYHLGVRFSRLAPDLRKELVQFLKTLYRR